MKSSRPLAGRCLSRRLHNVGWPHDETTCYQLEVRCSTLPVLGSGWVSIIGISIPSVYASLCSPHLLYVILLSFMILFGWFFQLPAWLVLAIGGDPSSCFYAVLQQPVSICILDHVLDFCRIVYTISDINHHSYHILYWPETCTTFVSRSVVDLEDQLA
jgi:hypothetical protein